MDYQEICLSIPAETAEEILTWLIEYQIPFQQSDQETLEASSPGTIKIYIFLLPSETDKFLQELAINFPGLAREKRIAITTRKEEEWRDQWKKFFSVQTLGRFVIVPSWEKYQAQPGEIILQIDPGRALAPVLMRVLAYVCNYLIK